MARFGASESILVVEIFRTQLLTTEQTPPPSLREVLGAYNSRGDGDRDMLIAMLNAKSAEDQVSHNRIMRVSSR